MRTVQDRQSIAQDAGETVKTKDRDTIDATLGDCPEQFGELWTVGCGSAQAIFVPRDFADRNVARFGPLPDRVSLGYGRLFVGRADAEIRADLRFCFAFGHSVTLSVGDIIFRSGVARDEAYAKGKNRFF